MLVLRLWNYMRGYVVIEVQGLTLEGFINMCMAKDIYLWDVRRIDNTTLEAKIGTRGFKELGEIVQRAGCQISICNKRGYPFWIHRLKKRKMLLIGAFFCFLLLVFVSTFIFTIEITGNEDVKKSEIMSKLNTLGLKPGVNRYLINLRRLENQMLLEINRLAWVGVEIDGIKAKVEVVEKIVPPDKIDKNTPCDITAGKSGVVEKIIAKNGYTIVNEGDIVKEGDILISGIVELEHIESNMLVHSCGEVYARTYYESTEDKNLTEVKKEKTGQKFVRRIFKLGSVEIVLNKSKIPYDFYIVEKKFKKPLQWRKIGFPVELVIEEYHEANEVEITINEIEAKKYVHKKALNNILEKIPFEAEILNTQIDFTTKDGVLYGKVILEALEDIAVKKALQIEEIEEIGETESTEED